MRGMGVLLAPSGYVNVGDPTAYPISVYNGNSREVATLAVMGVLTPTQAAQINAGAAKLEDFGVTLAQMSAAIDLMNAAGSLITSATDPATIAAEQTAVFAAQAAPGYTPAFVQPTSGTLVPMNTQPPAPAAAPPVTPAAPQSSGTVIPVATAAAVAAPSWWEQNSLWSGAPNWMVLSGAAVLAIVLTGGKKRR